MWFPFSLVLMKLVSKNNFKCKWKLAMHGATKKNECRTGNHLKIEKVHYRKCLWDICIFQKADTVASVASVIRIFNN